MQVITASNELINNRNKQSLKTGFVPTMGALHSGHLALIAASKAENEQTVCSIFVNPTQFNESRDFDRYPRQLDADIRLLEEAGCDILFAPSVADIYPEPDPTVYEFGNLTNVLEGAHRPGHFSGVASVVRRLLQIVQPDKAYFGLKDYQQFLVVKALIAQFAIPTEIIGFPTVREASGLAKSSRNMLLSPNAIEKAAILHQALKTAKDKFDFKHRQELEKSLSALIISRGFELDYFEIVHGGDLSKLKNEHQSAVALVAARIDGVRLIDNMRLN